MSKRGTFRRLRSLWKNWSASTRQKPRRGEELGGRRLRFEPLENRNLLAATDMAALTGRVFDDFSGNGYDPGEEVAQAIVQLYRDNGDSNFQSASDSLVASKTTDSSGFYRFDGLTAGTYFVRQPAQSASGKVLLEYVSSKIEISAQAAAGKINGIIDSFDAPAQSVTVSSPGGLTVSGSAQLAPNSLGGERDIYSALTSAFGEMRLSVNTFVPNRLEFAAASASNGRRVVTWDGIDGDAATLNPVGLNGFDLTQGKTSSAIELWIGADHPNGKITLRVYTDAGNWSEATVAIPATGGDATEKLQVPFATFTKAGGNGADFARAGAVQIEIDGISAVDGQVDEIVLIGPTVFNQNFANFERADLSLTKTVSQEAPRIGENVTFTIGVANAGPNGATNVSVSDRLPDGLEFVSSNGSQGSYNPASGIWTVGTLNNGAAASLQIVAKAVSTGVKTNVAQVLTSDQFDPDSTPGNNVEGEDDQAKATLAPQLVDLSLTKSVDNPTPNVGQNVKFTVIVLNAGPSHATGVAVSDSLPTGLTYVSSTASTGTYSHGTGIWSVGNLNNGGQASLEIVARVDTPGAKTNTAQVSAADQPDVDSTPGNGVATEDDQAAATITPQVADVSLTKSVNQAAPTIGENVVFTVKVDNAGPSAATNLAVTDKLPAGLQFVSANTSQGTYADGTGIWSVGTLADGASATLQLTAKVTAATVQTNLAQVTAMDQYDPDSTPANGVPAEDDQSSVSIEPRKQIDLSVTKAVNHRTPNVGDNVTFTVAVNNAGPSDATNVAVLDQLPSGLSYVSSTTTQGTYDDSTGIWTIGGVPNGATITMQIVARVNSSSRQINTAQIQTAGELDVDSTPGNDAAGEDDLAQVQIDPLVPIVRQNITISKRDFLSR